MKEKNVLISIKPEYVQGIRDGKKTVEIRRNCAGLMPGTTLWIYCTLPRGQIELVAEIASVSCGAPLNIWKKFGKQTGLTKDQYNRYVDGCDKVSAITLVSVQGIQPALKLEALRKQYRGFHPPQSFAGLSPDSVLLSHLNELRSKDLAKASRRKAFN